jgi:hypothetical protein
MRMKFGRDSELAPRTPSSAKPVAFSAMNKATVASARAITSVRSSPETLFRPIGTVTIRGCGDCTCDDAGIKLARAVAADALGSMLTTGRRTAGAASMKDNRGDHRDRVSKVKSREVV